MRGRSPGTRWKLKTLLNPKKLDGWKHGWIGHAETDRQTGKDRQKQDKDRQTDGLENKCSFIEIRVHELGKSVVRIPSNTEGHKMQTFPSISVQILETIQRQKVRSVSKWQARDSHQKYAQRSTTKE